MYDYRYGSGFVFSIMAMAAGAILYWAVTAPTHGFRLSTVGVVLMVAGAVGLVVSTVVLATSRTRNRQQSSYQQRTVDARGVQTIVREDVESS